MDKLNGILNNISSDIISITKTEDGNYEVYFKFLTIPVVMNRSYLENLLSSLLGNNNSYQLA